MKIVYVYEIWISEFIFKKTRTNKKLNILKNNKEKVTKSGVLTQVFKNYADIFKK